MKDLLVSSLASVTGATRAADAAEAWPLTFSIQVHINSWKRSLFGTRAGAGAGSGPGDTGPSAGRLRASFPRRVGGIVGSGEWYGEWSGERRQ